jgi:hypothetical protein
MRCSGIHQQHDPVDVKSLGDAIHFAAHRRARAESVRGDCPVSASDWSPSAATQCMDLNAAIDQAAFAAYGWTDLDPVQRVTAGTIHQLTWPQPCEPKVSF